MYGKILLVLSCLILGRSAANVCAGLIMANWKQLQSGGLNLGSTGFTVAVTGGFAAFDGSFVEVWHYIFRFVVEVGAGCRLQFSNEPVGEVLEIEWSVCSPRICCCQHGQHVCFRWLRWNIRPAHYLCGFV